MEEKIMDNEIMEVNEELVPYSGSSIGGKLIVGAIAAGVGFGIYKLVKKLKSKRKTDCDEIVIDDDNYVVEADDVEELNKKLN